MTVRNRFSERRAVRLDCSVEPGRAKQSMRDECDINTIVSRFVKYGTVTHLARGVPTFGVAPSISFHEAMEVVRKADEMFMELPAKLRRRFHESPAEYLEFCQDPKNLPELRKLGLANPEQAPVEPISVVLANGASPQGAQTAPPAPSGTASSTPSKAV